MKKYNFSFLSIVIFYIKYFYYKAVIYKEVKKGKARIYIAEATWVINNLLMTNFLIPPLFKTDYFETRFGKFYIVPDLVSTISISPAFEREDINYLLKLMKKKLGQKRKILFVDIGANIGLYSIIVGNTFKGKVKTIAFEPGTSYLSLPSYDYLKRNIKVNNTKNISVYKIGIGSKNLTRSKAGFATTTLDHALGKNYFKKYDTVFIKLDVDDFVVDALKGVQRCVDSGNEVFLLVEDFVNSKSIVYLQRNGYQFLDKYSTYNSFWKKNI